MKENMKIQTLKNQLGEIEFRRNLARQQTEGREFYSEEFDPKEIETILQDRMAKTKKEIESLKEQYNISTYLEIGAERCQRSLVLENDLEMEGIAFDISFDMLKSCDFYANKFNLRKIPARICGDANALPFASNSVPFVFCYETLHHFPNPLPILKEIYRILTPGGIFYFNEEPFRRVAHLNLYKGYKEYSKENLKRNTLLSNYKLNKDN